MTKELSSEQQQADVLRLEIAKGWQEGAIKGAAIRQAERQAKMELWQDPELMVLRKAIYEKGAIESLLEAQATGEYSVSFDLPPDHELPTEMRGQQPSTIRAWMAREPQWRDYIEKHVKMEEAKLAARKSLLQNHSEFAGIDYFKEKRKAKVEFGDEHKVRDGKAVKVTDFFTAKVIADAMPPEEKAKDTNVVAKFFAGILGK